MMARPQVTPLTPSQTPIAGVPQFPHDSRLSGGLVFALPMTLFHIDYAHLNPPSRCTRRLDRAEPLVRRRDNQLPPLSSAWFDV